MSTGPGWELLPIQELKTSILVRMINFPKRMIGHDYIVLGVVIADDTVVTDIKLHEIVTAGSNTTFTIFSQEKHGMGETIAVSKTEVFSTTVVSSNLQKDRMLFLLLKDKIPKDIFRPICIPPPRYLEKMVKPTSCRGEMLQTITKVKRGLMLLKLKKIFYHNVLRTKWFILQSNKCGTNLDSFNGIYYFWRGFLLFLSVHSHLHTNTNSG